ncbi:hypothetical protein EDD15DRAFT_2199383 [Pisolithus albus]|nr:hypothetical protein EDD15DRAFT_2199383 [Pisolithus albus]
MWDFLFDGCMAGPPWLWLTSAWQCPSPKRYLHSGPSTGRDSRIAIAISCQSPAGGIISSLLILRREKRGSWSISSFRPIVTRWLFLLHIDIHVEAFFMHSYLGCRKSCSRQDVLWRGYLGLRVDIRSKPTAIGFIRHIIAKVYVVARQRRAIARNLRGFLPRIFLDGDVPARVVKHLVSSIHTSTVDERTIVQSDKDKRQGPLVATEYSNLGIPETMRFNSSNVPRVQ